MANMAPLRDRILRHGVGLADAAAQEAALRTGNAGPRVTGAMQQGIEATTARLDGTTVHTSVVGREPYTKFVDQGTGLHGPARALIFPKRAKVMVFNMAGVAGKVFARFTRGQPAQNFFHLPMPQRWHDSLLAHTGKGNTFSQ